MELVKVEFNEQVELIKVTTTTDEIGDIVETEFTRQVLASKIDYRSKDYYQALTSGLKPSVTFGINKHEYDNERTLRNESRLYRILDVYPVSEKDRSEFEGLALLCEAVI